VLAPVRLLFEYEAGNENDFLNGMKNELSLSDTSLFDPLNEENDNYF